MSKHEQGHPLTHFHERITDITSRFSFTHHPVIDKSGLIVTAQGFARPVYHKPTNTVLVLFSKTANNLEGVRRKGGRIIAQKELLERCYIFGARRARGDANADLKSRANAHTIRRELREDLDTARRKLGKKSRKHYTLYGADNIFTNGRHMYEIVPRKGDGYDIVLCLSTRRVDGSFIPFDLNDKSLRGCFSFATRRLHTTKTQQEARQFISTHWRKLSGDLWENRNIYIRKGKRVMAKKLLADFANVAMNKGGRILGTTAVVGGVFSLIYGASLGVVAGFIAGMTSTALHTAIHLPIEFGVDEYAGARGRAKELRSMRDIDAYSFDDDVSDHFKIQTPQNLAKFCPHIDLDRFSADDFEFLPLDKFDLRKDREQIQDTLHAKDVDGHVMFLGQRGVSSQAFIPDDKSEVRAFQNGVIRYMHEKENGNIVVFAQYRPELCEVEELRLPQQYIDAFKGGIIRMEYDRMALTFGEGLVCCSTPISFLDMMKEVEQEHLFNDYADLSWDTRHQSYNEIMSSFIQDKTISLIGPRQVTALRGNLEAARYS